ncbi:MAG: tetratricopeptide repeat protein [Sporolactobacillus sp.]|jgi:tetratricopeptide (TPR) repeat protein|nr:tetratricopeptide repeat protein [Sporolactobacillus sp.]
MNQAAEEALRLVRKNKLTEAFGILDRAISADPDDPQGYTDFGNLLIAAGYADKALAFFEKALALDDRFAAADYGWGCALYEVGQYDEAGKRFAAAADHGFANGNLYYMIGRAAQKLGRAGQALAAFQRCVELNEHDVTARFQYGLLLARFGQLVDAQRQFRTVIRQQPRHADAWYNLGVIAALRRRPSEAKKDFHRALMFNPRYRLADAALKALERQEEQKKSNAEDGGE